MFLGTPRRWWIAAGLLFVAALALIGTDIGARSATSSGSSSCLPASASLACRRCAMARGPADLRPHTQTRLSQPSHLPRPSHRHRDQRSKPVTPPTCSSRRPTYGYQHAPMLPGRPPGLISKFIPSGQANRVPLTHGHPCARLGSTGS